jgi:hypothetical protein
MMGKMKSCAWFALLLVMAGCERIEVVESIYPDYEAAVSAGAIDRGWIPEFIPPSAKEIKETHNLDTNEVWVSFVWGSGEWLSVEEDCRTVEGERIELPRKSGGGWWPPALVEASNPPPRKSEYAYYRCKNGAVLAVQSKERRVYYWRS